MQQIQTASVTCTLLSHVPSPPRPALLATPHIHVSLPRCLLLLLQLRGPPLALAHPSASQAPLMRCMTLLNLMAAR